MNLMTWIKNRMGGDDTAITGFVPGQQEFAGINLKKVLDAHNVWNDRLKRYMEGSSTELLDAGQVAPDDICALGRWIYSAGFRQFGNRSEFRDLHKTHKQFHQVAGQILEEYNNGRKEQARALLHREFRDLSSQIQINLVRLYASAH